MKETAKKEFASGIGMAEAASRKKEQAKASLHK